MRYLVLLIALGPLICCQVCDRTWLCVVLFISIAALLHIFFSVVAALQALAEFGQPERRPH